jgi:hypothetical protein
MDFPMIARPLVLSLTLLLGGCDLVDQLLADPKAIQKEADAKAIGGGCRHGLRSLEDCYSMNDKASKSAIFTGWKDMDQYMRDNKIEGVESKGLKPDSSAAVAADEEVVTPPAKAEKKTAESKAKAKPKADEKG